MSIYFYGTQGDYGSFSNFSRHGFELDGAYWPTSEHYFQAQKFTGTAYAEKIRETKSPTIAARLGRSRKTPIRNDWESVKEDVMRRALIQKFTKHEDLRQLLLNTGEQDIVESSPIDYYWGCGKDGSGKNRLGILLMEVRDFLREKAR